jgi:RNA polymerase sigma-70 factor (ECF subfamily)
MSVVPMPRFVGQGSIPAETQPSLVERAVAGERDAFGELYERHVDRVYRFVWFHVGDAALARDLTQDVFVAALRGLPELRYADRFDAWLVRIAHNTVLNERRRASRRPTLTLLGSGGDDDLGQEPADESDSAADPERMWQAHSLAEAAADLTEAQRHVLALRFVGGLTLAETAHALMRSEEGVKKLQQRALGALRRRLDAMEQGQ